MVDNMSYPFPVFIIGSPRSGTTGLAWSLAAHKSFHATTESDVLWELFGREKHLQKVYQKIISRSKNEQPHSILPRHEISYEMFLAYLGIGYRKMLSDIAGGRRHIDHTPANTMMADDLALLFPGSQFIHIIRDGKSVVNSMMYFAATTNWSGNFNESCNTWVAYVNAARKFVQEHQENCIEIRLEGLIDNPEEGFNNLQEFLGVEPGLEMLQYFTTRRINSSYSGSTRQDYMRSVEEEKIPQKPWNNWSATEKSTFINCAGSLMEALGYDFDEVK